FDSSPGLEPQRYGLGSALDAQLDKTGFGHSSDRMRSRIGLEGKIARNIRVSENVDAVGVEFCFPEHHVVVESQQGDADACCWCAIREQDDPADCLRRIRSFECDLVNTRKAG